ncbi:hypothetical protein AKO1_001418, partial [Acrasis kona]
MCQTHPPTLIVISSELPNQCVLIVNIKNPQNTDFYQHLSRYADFLKNFTHALADFGETIPRTARQVLPLLSLNRTYTEVVQHGAYNQDMEKQGRPNQDQILEAFKESLKKVGENQEKTNEMIGKAYSKANEEIGKAHREANDAVIDLFNKFIE